MSSLHQCASHHLNGHHSAENYIDECVLKPTQEPHILFQILVQMDLTTEEGRAKLMGFTDCLHSWMRSQSE